MTDSVRLRILQTLSEWFSNVQEGIPADDPYDFQFSVVGIGHLGDPNATKRLCVGIVGGDETKTDVYPYRDVLFPIAIEFRITVNAGEGAPALMAERALATVQRVMAQDETIGGLAIDLREVRNHIDMDTYTDKFPTGVAFFEARYMHAYNDVRSNRPD